MRTRQLNSPLKSYVMVPYSFTINSYVSAAGTVSYCHQLRDLMHLLIASRSIQLLGIFSSSTSTETSATSRLTTALVCKTFSLSTSQRLKTHGHCAQVFFSNIKSGFIYLKGSPPDHPASSLPDRQPARLPQGGDTARGHWSTSRSHPVFSDYGFWTS